MKQETIEKAAFKYGCEHQVAPATGGELEKGFINGAHWRINAVWHDARKEVPEKCKPVLTERKTERKSGIFSVNVSAGMESCPLSWARWAYIDDLLPERKEEAK